MRDFPILVVDFAERDRTRITYVLTTYGLDCTAEQAEQLRIGLHPLPDEDEDLVAKVIECVRVDWQKLHADRLESSLRDLATAYRAASLRHETLPIDRKMRAFTRGLDEHPEWWEFPCECDECLSCV